MSNASVSDVEKDVGLDKEITVAHLSQQQEDLIEASEPPFTVAEDAGDLHERGAALEKVSSAKPSINNIKSVPNGGLVAWLQVVGSFFLFFNSWGIINTFGTYQTYYESGILSSSTPSNISWIGSIQAFLLMLIGAITGPIYDAGHVHALLLTGSFLIVFGQMMLSLCTEYYQVVLAQAICIGLGAGCIFVPAVAILSTYWSTRLATATGLAAAGSSLGGVIYPIIFYRLEPSLGFPWATRVIGFIMLATLAASNGVMKVRVLPAARRKFIDLSALREMPYLLFILSSFLVFMGLYAPFFYVQSYAISTGIMSENLAFYLLAVLNGASVFGRIIPNYIADTTGPINMIIPCAFATAILSLCLIGTHTSAPLIVICALYGFFSGTFVSLPPTIFVHLTANRALIGTRMGMGFTIVSVGLLVGAPISGAILTASSFKYVWIFGGIMTMIGALVVLACRFAKSGFILMKKV